MTGDLRKALKDGVDYLRKQGVEIPSDLSVHLRKSNIFHRDALKAGAESYDSIRSDYWTDVYDAVVGYLSGDQSVTADRNAVKRAVDRAFKDAAEAGYLDAGAELPLDDDAQAWLDGATSSEEANVDLTFQSLKMLRAEGDVDAFGESLSRADGYASTLDGIYNQAKLYGLENQMLTFDGEDGKVSCESCQELKGQRHRASWWIANDFVPPRGAGLDCSGGGKCRHYLVNDNGEQVTI